MKKILLLITFIFTFSNIFAKPDPLDIEFGPWITNVSDHTMTILWTTKTDNLGWVEITDILQGRWTACKPQKFYQEFAGRPVFGKMHSVTITGLKKGTEYRYRICGKKIVDDSQEQDLVYGIDKMTGAVKVRTFDSEKTECHFSAVNDMHKMTDKFSSLIKQVDPSSTDFILLNGDIASAGNYQLDTLVKYNILPLGKIAASVPVMFSRGNHEGRGNNWMAAYQVFPTRTPNQFYYTFRQGPVAFIVLDAGETKTTVSKSYVGETCYEKYLSEELEWAKEAVKEPEFANAPVKVCLIHVPMTGNSNDTDYSTQSWMAEHFIPMLNEAGIDLAINAHTHKFNIIEKGRVGNNFPMFINNNVERLQFDCDGKYIKIRTYDINGTEAHTLDIRK